MKRRDPLATVMIVILTIVGLVNFFAPFVTAYKTDPLITYIFMGTGATIAGYKGLATVLIQRLGMRDSEQKEKE